MNTSRTITILLGTYGFTWDAPNECYTGLFYDTLWNMVVRVTGKYKDDPENNISRLYFKIDTTSDAEYPATLDEISLDQLLPCVGDNDDAKLIPIETTLTERLTLSISAEIVVNGLSLLETTEEVATSVLDYHDLIDQVVTQEVFKGMDKISQGRPYSFRNLAVQLNG